MDFQNQYNTEMSNTKVLDEVCKAEFTNQNEGQDQLNEQTEKLVEINSQNLEDNDSISLNSQSRSRGQSAASGAQFSADHSSGPVSSGERELLIVDAPVEEK